MTVGVVPFPIEAAKAATRRFCVLFVALSEEARRLNKLTWRIKPKLNMFQ